MRLISIYSGGVFAHIVCSLALLAVSHRDLQSVFLAEPVLLGIMLFYGRRMFEEDNATLFKWSVAGAFLPAVLVAIMEIFRLSRSTYLFWQILALPSTVTSDEIRFPILAFFTLCAFFSIFNLILLAKMLSDRMKVLTAASKQWKDPEFSVGPSIKIWLAASLWLNFVLALGICSAFAVANLWVEDRESTVRRGLLKTNAEDRGSISSMLEDLGRLDYESGIRRLLHVGGLQYDARRNKHVESAALEIAELNWSATDRDLKYTYEWFITSYNAGMLQPLKKDDDAQLGNPEVEVKPVASESGALSPAASGG